MVYTKGDVVVIRLASGKEFEGVVLTSQENTWDLFKVRLIKTGTVAEVDPADVEVELIHRPESSITEIEEESKMNEVTTHVEEPVVIRSGVARGRKKVVITEETIQSFSRWVDVELPDGSRVQAQFRMLPSWTAGILRVRLPFATINVAIYSSKLDVDDIYIPPVRTAYSAKNGDTREVIAIEADEGQSELLKAIAMAVMSELGLSFKPAARTNSPTRGGDTHPVGSKTGNGGRRFSR